MARDDLARVSRLATQLAALAPKGEDLATLLAFMAGALYALGLAVGLEFDDARMTPTGSAIAAEVHDALVALATAGSPPAPWRSGFYVDSALMRLAAIDERLSKYLKRQRILPAGIADTVNHLKHDTDAGIRQGWRIRFDDLLGAAEVLTAELVRIVK